MGSGVKYSVVIPVYNEKDNIGALYERLNRVLDGLDGASEIIFVDDGSGDGSRDILERAALADGRVVMVAFDRNYGQHPAVVAGLLEARGEFVITLDADLQNPPEQIPVLLKEMAGGYDMVSGRRHKRKDSVLRKAPSFMTNLIISMVTGVWMEDYGSMLRVFRADTAKKLAKAFMERQAYITMLIPLVTKNIKEIDVLHDERSAGKSKYGFLRLMDAFIRIFFAGARRKEGAAANVFSVDTIVRDRKTLKPRAGV